MHGHFHARHIESYNCAVETLCRDCGDRPPSDAETCPTCGSVRIVRHKELHSLTIAHFDCDAFYATIEKRDHPELRNVPVIVGGHHRGVVAACCYIARRFFRQLLLSSDGSPRWRRIGSLSKQTKGMPPDL